MTFYDAESRVKFEDELKSRGYKYWKNETVSESCDYFYQKCFRDKLGRRYFIDIRFYDYTKCFNAAFDSRCDASVYFRDNKGLHSEKSDKNYFDKWETCPEILTNVEINLMDIDAVESFVQKLFETMEFEYYDGYVKR